MSDELKLQVNVDANVQGKAAVDALGQSVDTLGKDAKRAFADVSTAEKRAQSSTEQLAGAFAALGIRSAEQIEADILAVNQGLIKLASSSQLTGQQFDRAFAAGQAKIANLRSELNGVSAAADGTRRHADGLMTQFAGLAAAFSGIELARQFLTVNVQLEGMQRTFQAITGSSQKAGVEMAYVRDVADRLALPIVAAGKAYADLSAATKGTGVEGQATRAIFEAVANAMSVAGKSADETQGALLALSQIASKGVVQMEELRGQLGERLPGALNAAAAGFGITTAELIKLTESGQLTAEQLFPALTKGLNDLYGASAAGAEQTRTLAQRWEQLKNAIADAFKTIGDAGAVTVLKAGLEGLEALLVSASVGTVALGKNLGIFLAAIKGGDIGIRGFSDAAKAAFAEVEREAYDKLGKAAQHNAILAGRLAEAGKASTAAAALIKQSSSSVAEVGSSADQASLAITRLNVQYAQLAEAGKKATEQSKQRAEATKAQTDATISLAAAFGTEREQLLAKEAATQSNAEALRRLAVEKAADLTQTERHLAGLKAEIATRGIATESEQKQLDALQLLIAGKRTEAEAAAATAQSAAVTAASAAAVSAAYADNSARVQDLRQAYLDAKAAVVALDEQRAAGIDVAASLSAAEIAAGQAALLYRDALGDQTAAIIRNGAAKEAQISVEQAQVRLAIEQQRTILDVAIATGDERVARAALLEMKRLEIKLAELLAQAKKAEADAALLAVKARREELSAAGDLTAAKDAELKAQEAAAQVKKIEAEIAAEAAKRLRELAEASSQVTTQSSLMGDTIRSASAEMEQFGVAADRAKSSMQSLRDESISPIKLTRSGALGNGEPGNERTVVINHEDVARQAGLRGEAVKLFVQVFGDRYKDELANGKSIGTAWTAAIASAKAFAEQEIEKTEKAAAPAKDKLRAVTTTTTEGYIEKYSGAFDGAKALAKADAQKAIAGESVKTAGGIASVHRVEIAFGGKTATVDTADPDSARRLVDTLIELKNRSSK